ncbi:TfuA domain protein core [Methanobrevibacter sp. 87.7]|uniref:TfuA-related McrA-glycine thioamidation protein n=1 Tax=Methanobrevibacter sp. 87.7 TaxID=387957 RepID=UPI000B50E8AE|nr:TfuA-related McrA-glycine thioamidation protein [Methanobrevibacter sp. 87.7]OWT33752.1 TfuA domain protein core [Methanobrevibacter sp. 87.7]
MSNKKIVVYTGLSLSFDEAKKILDADYRPPIKRGDIIEMVDNNNLPDIIGIIDGQFQHTPAVAHKEIIAAMNKGTTVVGGSSMGALRASELDSMGMIGIGYVYKQYVEGNIKSDDDVAVILDPETYEPLSEAYVNIEYKANGAAKEGIITEKEKEDFLKTAKNIYYPHRTYPRIFKECNLSEDKKNKLIRYINHSVNIKTEDAKDVLKYIKKISKDN